jgi:hypothetical protein
MTLCPICGWGGPCTSVMQAVVCDNIKENWRKYMLRYKGEIARNELPTPTLVKSIRGFDPTSKDGPGRGNSWEELVPVSIETARELLQEKTPI